MPSGSFSAGIPYLLIFRIMKYSFSSVPSFRRMAFGLIPAIRKPIFSYSARARRLPSANYTTEKHSVSRKNKA